MVTIGEKIKELRKINKLSRRELSEQLGCSQNHIYLWEIGKFEPKMFYCICMADIFNISLDELCCRDFKGGK